MVIYKFMRMRIQVTKMMPIHNTAGGGGDLNFLKQVAWGLLEIKEKFCNAAYRTMHIAHLHTDLSLKVSNFFFRKKISSTVAYPTKQVTRQGALKIYKRIFVPILIQMIKRREQDLDP